MVLRLLVYLCDGTVYHDENRASSTPCDVAAGPLARPDAQCSTLVYAWARGAGRLVLPDNVGFLASAAGKKRFAVLHATYVNPDGRPDVTDSSGVRLYYSLGSLERNRRMKRAGTLILGDPLHAIGRVSVVKSNFVYTFTCPSVCTRRYLQQQKHTSTSSSSSSSDTIINLAAVFPFMRVTGRAVTLSVYDASNVFSRVLAPDVSIPDFFSSYRHRIVHLPPGVSLSAGEQLALSCVYDTTKRPNTAFEDDEICVAYVPYWPVVVDETTGHEFGLCAMERSDEGNIGGEMVSVCAEPGKLIDWHEHVDDFPMAKNPAFDDTYARSIVMRTGFGDRQNVDTCRPDEDEDDDDDGQQPIVDGDGDDGDDDVDDGVGSSIPSTTEPNQDNVGGDDDDGSVCFPAHATVTLQSGGHKRMDDLVIGDSVLVSLPSSSSSSEKRLYSTVFLFTHNDHNRVYSRFVTLVTAGGHNLTATAGHYVYVDGGTLTRMRDVRVGMTLTKAHDVGQQRRRRVTVTKVTTGVTARGLFNPQTVHGDIVVDGVTATTFTQAIDPVRASVLLAPLRGLYGVVRAVSGERGGRAVMTELSRMVCSVV